MGTRIPSHQLKNGLLVSGPPEHLKEKQPTMASRAVPYTGGDVKKSGELGKMFDIPVLDQHSPTGAPPMPKQHSRPSSSSQHNSGSVRSGPNSGPVKKSSGPLPLQPTGLITSGPLGSGPLGSGPLSSAHRRSGQLDRAGSGVGSSSSKSLYGSAVTSLTEDVNVVKKAVILVAVGAILVPVILGLVWNCVWGRRGLLGFVKRYPDAELRGAIDGQYVKVTGVVTCGSIPLESSYQRVPSVYTFPRSCIKEGSTVSVMGVVRRHDNVLMIVPPQEPVSTGCQWFQCLLPTYVEGLVLMCDDNQDADVVPV
ncbi:hypothetical protein GH714_000225 [Hevea brasiliensis]|uniref:Uncharacterized protein n=1 Tax=Hevea brasiliensis TaxID=3981 RepID=A0A6A6M933_HEVBR|nr:hypothetical protein GH714_000225 [Hevea brasiliensis]